MNLVIDVGNTMIKTGTFEGKDLKDTGFFGAQQDLKTYLQKTKPVHVIFSSVAWAFSEIENSISATGTVRILGQQTSLPVTNHYATPGTLGADRIASACGAWSAFPNHNSLVIDIGTCINYDFVNKSGHYMGGAISPGIKLRFSSMHEYTAKLPLAEPVLGPDLTGNSTIKSLQSGVMNGILEEIKGVINRYETQYRDIRVILCGGDCHFFEKDLKPSIFVAPELVLKGLNSILLHNVNP